MAERDRERQRGTEAEPARTAPAGAATAEPTDVIAPEPAAPEPVAAPEPEPATPGPEPGPDGVLLELRGIKTQYGPVRVLRGVDLTVNRGQMVCLLGPNAAGKTTTLKTILGMVQPTEGEVLFDGERIDGDQTTSVVARGITMVPENRRLFTKLTVRENLQMGAFTRKDASAIEEDMDRVFTLFPRVKERMSQKAGTLSGGEQQMVAMGRALMARPKLLLMDEPSMGLAPILVEQVFTTIKEINEQGTTVFLVEQNANMALAIADYGYVLQTGEIVLSDTAANLLEHDMMREAYLGEL